MATAREKTVWGAVGAVVVAAVGALIQFFAGG